MEEGSVMIVSGVAAFEGEKLDDGRWLYPGGVTWETEEADLPVNLADGSRVGRVLSIVRVGTALTVDLEVDDTVEEFWPALSFGQFSIDDDMGGIRGEILGVTLHGEKKSNGDLPLFVVPNDDAYEAALDTEEAYADEVMAAEEAMAEKFLAAMAADVGDRQWRDANQYQRQCLTTAKMDTVDTWYFALGLAGEVGEVVDHVKKLYRDDNNELTRDRYDKLVKELGDVSWYLAVLSASIGVDLGDVFATNVNKLKDRHARGRLHGDGDDR